MNPSVRIARAIVLASLSVQTLCGAIVSGESTSSMKTYVDGEEKLVVYTDVPGHGISMLNGYASRAKSDIYEIWVRSAASNNEWVQCFANMTYNRGAEMPEITGFGTATAKHAYQRHTAGWTHTYANIEMSDHSPVEVEVRKIGATTLDGSASIVKSAVHPAHKIIPGSKRDENGRVYFKIDKPCQIVIDINGQMDDHNAAYPSNVAGGRIPDGSPVHSVAFYANPILAKPVASPTHNVLTIDSSQSTPSARLIQPDPATYDTLQFGPGIHNIGPNFKVHPGKNYYIPGDAILYGNMGNGGVAQGAYRSTGDHIRIYGYGTLCGIQVPHYQNNTNNPEYPEWNAWTGDKDQGVGIELSGAWDTTITGVTSIDPANFNTKFDVQSGRTSDQSSVSWVKLHSWRVNGDGFGGYAPVEDSFFRTSDDSTYVRDWRRRCTFWKDTNANIFRFVNYKSGGLDDCDIIYARWRDSRGVGSVFEFANGGFDQAEVLDLNLTIRNIRFHDKHSNPRRLFSMDILQSYRGLVFENISAYLPKNDYKSVLLGSAAAPWYERLVFKNVTYRTAAQDPYDTGTLLTEANFNDYFITNEFVKYVLFDHPRDLTIAITADPAKGSVTKNPNQATHVETTLATLTAIAKPGYVFTGWVGLNQEDPTTDPLANPMTIRMLENRSITANFGLASIELPVVIDMPITGTWTVPAGVYSATFQAWGGGGSGGSAHHRPGSTNISIRGGGGTGGGYASETLQVVPGQVIHYSVGAGGVGSSLAIGEDFPSISYGGDGGASFASLDGGAAIVSAVGGLGGTNKSGTTMSVGGSSRSAPSTGNIGAVKQYGGDGGITSAFGTGGGGGSAGSLGDGGDGGVVTAGIAGPGGGAAGAVGHNTSANGNNGEEAGGGGSGAGLRNSSAPSAIRIGGNGGDGKMIVTYNTMTFSLTTNAMNGTVNLSPPGGVHLSGSSVQATAVPDPGYEFVGWSGALSGNVNPTSVLMDDNKTITANFAAQLATYTLTATSPNGVVTFNPPGPTYPANTLVTVTVVPNSGNTFTGWGGDLTGTTNPTSITMNADKSITANIYNPVLSRAGWVASASSGNGSAGNAIDGVITSRWSTGANQVNGQWFRVDMGAAQTFNQIVLDGGSSAGDYPRGYQVHVSNDGVNWGIPIATGAGSSGVTTITFEAQTARYIRVTQTGSVSSMIWWSIHEFNVYQLAYSLTENSLDGSVTFNPPGPTYPAGTEITVTATPDSNYAFSSWGGSLSGTTNPTIVTINGNRNVTANFSSIANPFIAWAGAGVNFEDDANSDGLANGMAWLLGAAHPADFATSLPRVPSQIGGDLVIDFTCLKIPNRGSAILKLQYSKDLGHSDPWTANEVAVSDEAMSVGAVVFSVPSVNPNSNLVNLRATIPTLAVSSGNQLFVRLKGGL